MLSRSVSGVFPDTAVLGMRPGGVRTELIYETTIPTIEGAAETAARLSRPQLEQERARHPGQSPPGGAQALNPGITGRPMAASTPQRLPFSRAARIKQGRDFARHPNRGYLGMAELPDKAGEWTQGQTRFRFREGDLKAWDSITNAEVVAMTKWVESRLPVTGVDEKGRIVTFSKRSVFGLEPGDLYYAEGAFEFLDEPGEWYLDAATGTLYYLPRPGEQITAVQAIAPVLPQVVRIEGRPEAGQFVERVVVRGLTFSHTEWCFPDGFHSGKNKPNISPAPKAEVGGFGQAAVGVPGAVWGEGLRDCVFEDCRFSSLGNYGLELTRGCQRNRIMRCEFSDLGAGGLKIGETSIRDQAAEQTGGNEISGCHIHDGGKMFASGIGIWIGQSPSNRILHNLIHAFYYTGISIGWTWGYGPALATNNTVALNHVHHIGVKSDGDGPILSDMGGIYTLGKQPGTTVRNNLWHDIAGIRYGGWGIYFDEGSSGIVAGSNVVYRTTHGGFHQHYRSEEH